MNGVCNTNSDDLVVFLRVAEEGSITKAAQRLGYVPSNVTARIQQLEMETGTALFYRHSRGTTLTPAGRVLVDYAQKIQHLLNNALAAVQDSDVPKGPLVIGSMETAAAVRLPKILASYHRMYPEVDVTLATGTSAHMIQQILEYKLDGAIVSGPVDQSELHQETVFLEELVLASEPTNAAVHDLIRKPILVFRTGCSYRAKLEQWLWSEGVPNPRIMEFGSLEAILGGVSAGLGVSLLPRSVVLNLKQKGLIRCYGIPVEYGTVETVFIYRKDAVLRSAMISLLRLLKKTAVESTDIDE